MARHGFRAGHLIRAGAIGTCIRTWHEGGSAPQCWRKVRRVLRELFPEARTNSLEAVIRVAQATAAVARAQRAGGPDFVPDRRTIPDARRLIRDALRE